jgi:ketosteroid isomerase-like protein
MVGVVDRAGVEQWVAGYERAWRSPGTEQLAELFTPDVSYLPSPWGQAVEGLDALAAFWDGERDSPDESFTMTSEVVAVEGDMAVVRVAVDYVESASRWRDLWVIHFAEDGRCRVFEEWPFAPEPAAGV